MQNDWNHIARQAANGIYDKFPESVKKSMIIGLRSNTGKIFEDAVKRLEPPKPKK